MGWFSNLIDVASLSMEIAQVDRLSDLRRQNATMAVLQSIQQGLRNIIFNYKQVAHSMLEMEGKSPKIAAGGLRILDERIKSAGITTDLFSELTDMEYVADTNKFIRENATRLMSQLNPEEVQEVELVAKFARSLPRYKYYIDNQSDYLAYKEAKRKLGTTSGQPGISPTVMGCGIFLGGMLIIGLFISLFGESTGLFLGFAISAGLTIWLSSKNRSVRKANETVKRLDEKLDIRLLEQIDYELYGGLPQARRLYNETLSYLKNFFGDSGLLPSDSGQSFLQP